MVYIRSINEVGEILTRLVTSKSRVAPTNTMSPPRLELLAAVANSRLLKFVAESLSVKIDQVVCWTDSMVALQWIRGSNSQWKTFMANCVAEIQSSWDPCYWRHCSGEDNLADLLTCGLGAKALNENELWWNGPSWLASQCWPNEEQPVDEVPASVQKEKSSKQTRSCTVVATRPVIDPSQYEKWLCLIRVTAYLLRWAKVFKAKKSVGSNELTAEQLQNAKLNWHCQIQRDVYPQEYEQL